MFYSLMLRSATFLIGVIIVSAGAGVHGCYKHDDGRVFNSKLCPGDGDEPLFHGLAHNLQHGPLKFRQFIQE